MTPHSCAMAILNAKYGLRDYESEYVECFEESSSFVTSDEILQDLITRNRKNEL